MEEVKKKIKTLLDALKTLQDGIEYFYECEQAFDNSPDKHNERAFLSARDSIIQRFEYCIDLFWKVIKVCLDSEKIDIPIVSSRGIIREAVRARFLSEDEGTRLMRVVDARNKTSHTYHENMAQQIAHEIPEFYELMQLIGRRMQDRWGK